jgi:hypothetical protein
VHREDDGTPNGKDKIGEGPSRESKVDTPKFGHWRQVFLSESVDGQLDEFENRADAVVCPSNDQKQRQVVDSAVSFAANPDHGDSQNHTCEAKENLGTEVDVVVFIHALLDRLDRKRSC